MALHRYRLISLATLLVVGVGACEGGAVITPDRGRVDAAVYYDIGTGGPDINTPLLQPGDNCPLADCFSDTLLCIGGICRVKCAQPKPGCNHAAPECPVGTTCLPATTFTDACFPATGALGDTCDAETPCGPTLVCVQVSGPATCVALCSRGCQAGEECLETAKSCMVCIKRP
ncbi:MAG: hypothetical protein KC503_24345 [Myxococcales bacterium]|nr:hypothetical protein [Myxococcales bacterium]